MNKLSDRWKLEEREAFGKSGHIDPLGDRSELGTLGHSSGASGDTKGFGRLRSADISGWARGISKPFGSQFKPKRPNCAEAVKRTVQPITNLKAVREFVARKPKEVKHDRSKLCFMPEANDHNTGEAEAGRTAEVGMMFDRFYAKMRIAKRSKVKVYD